MRTNLKSAIEVKFGSQIAFSKKVCIHHVRLSKIVRGWIDPTPIERDRIIELLNVSPDFLFKTFTIPTGHAGPTDGDVLTEVAGQLGGTIKTIDAATEARKV